MSSPLPIVWSIAASDSAAGAGIQADLKTLTQHGVYACTVVTAVTAQHYRDVFDITVLPAESVRQQIIALQTDFWPCVVKLGVLGDEATIAVIAEFLQSYDGIVIYDPVSVASCGKPLLSPSAVTAVQNTILPHVDIITPNYPESLALQQAGWQPSREQCLIVKGGHAPNQHAACDIYSDQQQRFTFSSPRSAKTAAHGSGCVFSAALAAFCAQGNPVLDALVKTKMWMTQAIQHQCRVNARDDGFNFFSVIETAQQFPAIALSQSYSFPSMELPIGLYPIVASVAEMSPLFDRNITTLQLRLKHTDPMQLNSEIALACQLCRDRGIQLFINDHWQLALRHGAFGVHLGQEDLLMADLQAIEKACCRLGISSHSDFEAALALSHQPSYLAFGAVFTTTSKSMPTAPQGISKLRRMRSLCKTIPLVAIGGINAKNLAEVQATGVDGIAMIRAIEEVILDDA